MRWCHPAFLTPFAHALTVKDEGPKYMQLSMVTGGTSAKPVSVAPVTALACSDPRLRDRLYLHSSILVEAVHCNCELLSFREPVPLFMN
jgi:hypothetical protein